MAAAAGMVGAAVLGGMMAHRARRQRYREFDQWAGWSGTSGLGDLSADRSYSVLASDGVALHVEEVGPTDAPVTVILVHGWTLNIGAWHFQRAAADSWAPGLRLVLYDQRSHGRSTRAGRGRSRLSDLADDLASVIATAAPTGPVILVGHSMGGMAILALAGQRLPPWQRVRGVALLSTSAVDDARGWGGFSQLNGSNPVLPWLMSLAGRYPKIAERGRAVSRDAVWLATRTWGFADPQVPASLVDYVDAMISEVPLDVIAEFAPALLRHDQTAALPLLADLPVLIAVGQEDRMTPPHRSKEIADALPAAQFEIVPGCGHLLPLERPGVVNDGLAVLVDRAQAAVRAVGD